MAEGIEGAGADPLSGDSRLLYRQIQFHQTSYPCVAIQDQSACSSFLPSVVCIEISVLSQISLVPYFLPLFSIKT